MAVERRRITSTSYTLCPGCRMRQEGTKLKPTRRINPSIPLLLPPVVAPPCNPPRPCFFNFRGEIIAPSPVPVAVAPMRVCMRFGCGARLAPNQLFNFCNACVRLGFGRAVPALPPTPKHFPKRMRRDELPSGLLISKVKRDIDAVQKAEALIQTPRETFAELNARDNDDLDTDLDLELMYPEDEELAAQDSVDLTTKVVVDDTPPPGAVLEDGSSWLSPLVLNTTARSPSPQLVQRTCETPGCGGTVSPSATWQRCYNCSLQRWKERQQAATATTEPVLPVDSTHEGASNSAEVMHGIEPSSHDALDPIAVDRVATSRESGVLASQSQGAVLGAVDKLPLSELPDGQVAINSTTVTSTSSTLTVECGRDARAEPEINKVHTSRWDSDLTNLSREDDGVDSDLDGEDSSTIKIRIPVLASQLPSGTSARVCGIKRCNIVLPPDHRWKICDPCRRYLREYQRIRMGKIRRRMKDFSRMGTHESLVCDPPAPFSEKQTDEMMPAEGSRVCAVPCCYTRLPPVTKYRWKCCGVCRMRARDDARAKRSNARATLDSEEPVEQTSSLDISSFPVFQNRSKLLSEFSAMLGWFLEAQILYLRVKLQTAGEKALLKLDPMLFAFDGEYSTVTGQRRSQDNVQVESGPEHRQEEMQKEVASTVRELDRTLLAEFKPTESFIIKSGGVIMRYKCTLELIVPLRPLSKTTHSKDTHSSTLSANDTSSSHVPYMKSVFGELEVAVVPDNSHSYLLGRRTIIRFRMLG
ncbi:hypothetical protein BDR04DRAFT_276891 [Suillus decipiens]|nr:hypothetical protein BDR04DRAFT_276891 [Suillus decipiens]